MKKKDYELIASAIRIAKPLHRKHDGYAQESLSAWVTTANVIANKLQTDNAKFQRGRFLEACGLDNSGTLIVEVERVQEPRG